MDYEKKYKKALENARQEYNTTENVERKQWLEELFPELKKSDGERIRGAIIHFISHTPTVPKGIIGKETMIAWLEKQGEQKPIDKVEPKFHEGEWITNGDYTWKIVEVKSLDYILQSQDGNIVDDTISHVDEQFHSFTIKDAKDGDVLADKYNNIGIFQKCEGICWYSYIYLGCDGELRGFYIGGSHEQTDVHPATKEQRDTLERAITNAGWEFDFEKKELKKVEDEEYNGEDYGIDSLYHAQRILEKTLGEVDGYQTDDGILDHKAAITAVKKLYGQKPTDNDMKEALHTEYEKGRADAIAEMQNHAWSEEDMSKVQRICKYLNEAKKYYADITEVRECMDWLKSLKDRVQPQQEWSEDDEKRIKNILSVLDVQVCWDGATGKKENHYQKEIDWLKSLRPQTTWKPSDEQMKALHDLNLTGNISYAGQGQTLVELYNNLKKLKGN